MPVEGARLLAVERQAAIAGGLPVPRKGAGIPAKEPRDVAAVRSNEPVPKFRRNEERRERQDAGGVSPAKDAQDEQAGLAGPEDCSVHRDDVKRFRTGFPQLWRHGRRLALLVRHGIKPYTAVVRFEPLNGTPTDTAITVPKHEVAAWHITHGEP